MGEDCYVIVRKSAKGDESSEFYSISSGLLIQSAKSEPISEGAEPTVTTIQYTEYKNYDGLKLPSKLSMNAAGQDIEFVVSSMKLNEKLKSKDFVWEE